MATCWGDQPPDVSKRLVAYRSLILEWNRKFNLTALRDADAIDARLIAESLRLLPLLPADSGQASGVPLRAVDIGTGAGIPGLPLAIARPDIEFTLIDATGKKIGFVALVAERLGLANVATIHGRAETIAHDHSYRETYDIAVARAVTHLAALAEIVLPVLKVGGRALLPKGEDLDEELRRADVAIRQVGGRLVSADRLPAHVCCGVTRLAILDKIEPSLARYPRRPGIPEHDPLGG